MVEEVGEKEGRDPSLLLLLLLPTRGQRLGFELRRFQLDFIRLHP